MIVSKNHYEQLKKLAYYDLLTSAYNRNWFEHYFINNYNQKSVDLCLIDLNNFKKVNDTLGHKKGDEFLIEFVKELSAFGTVIRFGGDEFILIVKDKDGFMNYADNQNKFSYGYHSKSETESVEQAIQHADEKMYDMKHRTKV